MLLLHIYIESRQRRFTYIVSYSTLLKLHMLFAFYLYKYMTEQIILLANSIAKFLFIYNLISGINLFSIFEILSKERKKYYKIQIFLNYHILYTYDGIHLQFIISRNILNRYDYLVLIQYPYFA